VEQVNDFVAAVRKEVTLDTATLTATPVTLPSRTLDQVIQARLSGTVNGYTWPINGKLCDPANNSITVKRDQRV
jgi:multicopper oxidase